MVEVEISLPQNPPITNPQFLLAAWSEQTTLAEKITFWNSKPYADSPRKGERRRVYRRTGKAA